MAKKSEIFRVSLKSGRMYQLVRITKRLNGSDVEPLGQPFRGDDISYQSQIATGFRIRELRFRRDLMYEVRRVK